MDFITIRAKDKEHSHAQIFHITSMDNITLSHDDKSLQRMVEQVTKRLDWQPEKIEIKATFLW